MIEEYNWHGLWGSGEISYDVAVASWYMLWLIVYFTPSPYPHLHIHNYSINFFYHSDSIVNYGIVFPSLSPVTPLKSLTAVQSLPGCLLFHPSQSHCPQSWHWLSQYGLLPAPLQFGSPHFGQVCFFLSSPLLFSVHFHFGVIIAPDTSSPVPNVSSLASNMWGKWVFMLKSVCVCSWGFGKCTDICCWPWAVWHNGLIQLRWYLGLWWILALKPVVQDGSIEVHDCRSSEKSFSVPVLIPECTYLCNYLWNQVFFIDILLPLCVIWLQMFSKLNKCQ